MAEKTQFIIVSFKVGARGRLVASTPQIAKTLERAIASGQRLSESQDGVAVLQETSDAEAEIFAEPKLAWRFGRIPEEILAMDAL